MQTTRSKRPQPIANSVLAALPRKTYQRLASGLQPVALGFGEVLYEPGETMRDVYFPTDGLVSLLTLVEGRFALEVGLVGREGMLGVALALGVGVSPIRALVQGAGTALRMNSARFRKELQRSAPLQRELYRYTNSLMGQITQTAACNRFHLLPARLARWLLMTSDRVRSAQFRMTHEFLSHMLGVRRVGVTEAASALQQRKLIAYRRGNINILDRAGLEAASCSCYRVVKQMYNGKDGARSAAFARRA
jgi:CRP-like cAMP-binding protein